MDNKALAADLVEWVAEAPRSYSEVMAAWRTTCPRLTIWEDCIDEGLLCVDGQSVRATTQGFEFLEFHGRAVKDG